ncbi:ISAs1 family transposase, partial [Desulfotomaculum copahuensis]|uniref:ISAs1 family transposase n=1 Tax=Desulfotomaculum copahuensis TaxID=1838280 RepID=UPI00249F5EA8
MRIFPPPHTTIEKGHGRIETRTGRTIPVLEGQTGFPYADQFIKIERSFTDLHGENTKKETAYFVTSMSAEKADPKILLELIRGHWAIETSLHWVRDVTFDEDRSQIRTGSAPRVFASIRNLAISLLRLHGFKNIAAGLRKLSWNAELAL